MQIRLYFFINKHPGGEVALIANKIKNENFQDSSEFFENVGHSMDAMNLMNKFQIGILVL